RTKATARRAATRTPKTLVVTAVGADAADLDAVIRRDKAVARRRLVHPAVEIARLHFDDAMAALANEVVMVGFAAEAVALLPAVVGEDIDHAGVAEERERAVDGSQTRGRVPAAQPAPQLLRGRVVPLERELREHLEPPRRRADAVAFEQSGQFLRSG